MAVADHNNGATPLPDGITEENMAPHSGARHPASVLSLAVLGAIVALGLSAYSGGGRPQHHAVSNAAVDVVIDTPTWVRTGEIFETRLHVVAHTHIGKLVIGVEPALWRQLTTLTIMPAAQNETHQDGLTRLTYGTLHPAQAFELQIVQQINPSLFGVNRGRLVILDDQRPLAEVALATKVLP